MRRTENGLERSDGGCSHGRRRIERCFARIRSGWTGAFGNASRELFLDHRLQLDPAAGTRPPHPALPHPPARLPTATDSNLVSKRPVEPFETPLTNERQHTFHTWPLDLRASWRRPRRTPSRYSIVSGPGRAATSRSLGIDVGSATPARTARRVASSSTSSNRRHARWLPHRLTRPPASGLGPDGIVLRHGS